MKNIVTKTAKEVNVSSDKISKQFKKISNVEALIEEEPIEMIETSEESE